MQQPDLLTVMISMLGHCGAVYQQQQRETGWD